MSPILGLPLAIFLIRIISPLFVFLATLSLFFTSPASSIPQSPSPVVSVVVASRQPRRAAILPLLSLAALTFLGDGLTFVLYAVFEKTGLYTGLELNAVIGLTAFSGLAALGTWKEIHGVEVWFLTRLKAAVAVTLSLDIALVFLLGKSISTSGDNGPISTRLLLHIAFPALRILLLLPLLACLCYPRVVYTSVHSDSEEATPTASSFLLPPDVGSAPSGGLLPVPNITESSKYGTFRPGRSILQQSTPNTRAPTPTPSAHTKSDEKPDVALDPSWSEFLTRIRRLAPYLWPSKSPSLQFLAVMCIGILLVGRVVNLLMPFTLGQLILIFEHRSDRSPWLVLGFYVFLRFLQGSGGLAALRDTLWAPVMQYSDREMSQMSFNHLLNLSFAFHTRRKTGEILRVLDRGAAINNTLELILFNIVPTFIDIIVALVVFCVKFEWTIALVIFVVMFAYIAASVILTQWRTKIRRQMNERDIVTRGIHTDCLLNYESVKYFGGEQHEADRYRAALSEYQALEYRVIISLNLLNLVQNFIITFGLLVGSILVARRVIRDGSGPSDFVIFITYLAQLYNPLNQLGYVYRSINQSLVDTEKLLKLLGEPTDVNDKPNAPELILENGEIEFDNVNFSYDGRTTALNGVSFKVPKNSSVALVGESGSGKSTILRLLYRFYDLGEGQGRILIDGKDIRDVTQKSLRQVIGVVPQDSVLFNTSIGYNIGYGKFGASLEEIEAAAKSAQMHDRIMSFPNGYETTVGERGVRLSGGEKQRVSIARTLLKNPPILLLDEATSALDTSTEKDIQKALQNLMAGRSSLSIAHRLSTIASADIILVLKNGQIVEQGSHKELLALDGTFAAMWADQVSSADDAAVSIVTDGKPELSGYSVDEAAPEVSPLAEDLPVADEAPIGDESQPAVAAEEAPVVVESPTPVTFPSPVEFLAEEPITFPSADATVETGSPVAEEPVGFPVSEEPETPQTPVAPQGVTFETSVDTPPRTGTPPDPDAEPKRKRISSQNFQRLARRISITPRRQGTLVGMIPGLKKSDSSPKASIDEPVGGSGQGSTDSPTSSISGDTKLKKSKKDKKRKSLM
ncbi:mitochondrial half-size ABC transporter [Mycena floridula]|nr:mitochondrial half-size ABC transporter [Mycena floridula]